MTRGFRRGTFGPSSVLRPTVKVAAALGGPPRSLAVGMVLESHGWRNAAGFGGIACRLAKATPAVASDNGLNSVSVWLISRWVLASVAEWIVRRCP
jgi:hypothetical protein